MVVSEHTFDTLIKDLELSKDIGFDTETYGLRYTDRLFSIIFATNSQTYYLNFNRGKDHLGNYAETVLDKKLLRFLEFAFQDKTKTFYSHNAIYDLQKIALEGVKPPVNVHCSRIAERLIRNDSLHLSLDKIAPRYGCEKDDTVDLYIEKYKLYTKVEIPGKNRKDKVKHFDLVPFSIMTYYGENDARIHRKIGIAQRKNFGHLLQ